MADSRLLALLNKPARQPASATAFQKWPHLCASSASEACVQRQPSEMVFSRSGAAELLSNPRPGGAHPLRSRLERSSRQVAFTSAQKTPKLTSGERSAADDDRAGHGRIRQAREACFRVCSARARYLDCSSSASAPTTIACKLRSRQ